MLAAREVALDYLERVDPNLAGLRKRPGRSHAHALELAREGVPLNIIQRQIDHANFGTTSIYLRGIDTAEIIATVHARRAR